MSVTIKSEHEIELMREAGRILSIVHQEMEKIIRPGISTMDINRKGEEVIRSYDCIPSFLNYQGYPASICVSVNDEVVHGIPSKKRILKEGDIVSQYRKQTLTSTQKQKQSLMKKLRKMDTKSQVSWHTIFTSRTVKEIK